MLYIEKQGSIHYTYYYYVALLQGEVEKCGVQSGGGDPVVVFSGVWDCFRWFQYNLVPLGNQNCHTSIVLLPIALYKKT